MYIKQSKSHGRIYLSIVEGYRINGKVRQKTIEKLGYLEDLQKLYDDPIAHFTKRVEQLKKEKKTRQAPIKFTFFDSDKQLICPEHSYSFYPVYCGFYDIPRLPVELNDDWTLKTDKMVQLANENHSSTIFANPNAPTSLGLTREQVREMLEKAPKDQVFVVDEAYVDFGGESSIPLLKDFKNLVVVRTFSKSLCGAGMRSGYIVANPELINAVTTVKNSLNHFPMDAVTQVASTAACNDVAYYVECAKKVCQTREDFISFLKKNGYQVNDSKTNFVFLKKNGLDGKKAYEFIKENGILVRRFDTPGIEEYLRITIGTQEQMDKLKEIMEKL